MISSSIRTRHIPRPSLQQERLLPETCLLRRCKYLNNVVEQDHRFIKRRVNPGLGFGALATAQRTIQG